MLRRIQRIMNVTRLKRCIKTIRVLIAGAFGRVCQGQENAIEGLVRGRGVRVIEMNCQPLDNLNQTGRRTRHRTRYSLRGVGRGNRAVQQLPSARCRGENELNTLPYAAGQRQVNWLKKLSSNFQARAQLPTEFQ